MLKSKVKIDSEQTEAEYCYSEFIRGLLEDESYEKNARVSSVVEFVGTTYYLFNYPFNYCRCCFYDIVLYNA